MSFDQSLTDNFLTEFSDFFSIQKDLGVYASYGYIGNYPALKQHIQQLLSTHPISTKIAIVTNYKCGLSVITNPTEEMIQLHNMIWNI